MNNKTHMNKPYEIINQGTTAQITLFGFIDWWNDDNNSFKFKNEIDALLQAGIKNVNGYINSGGGDVFEANEIVNQIKRFTGVRSCLIGSICASAATMVMMAFQKENVQISPNGFLMYHPTAVGQGGSIADMQKKISLMEKLESNYVAELVAWTGKPEEEIKTMIANETWLTADEAVTGGFVNNKASSNDTNNSIFASFKKENFKNIPTAVSNFIDVKPQELNQNLSTMKIEARNSITGMLSLPSNATDEDITAAVKTALDKAGKADDAVLNATKNANKIVANMIVTAAITDKKITEEEKEQYITDATANPELVARVLAKMPTPIKASANQGAQESQEDNDKSKWTFKDYQEKDPKALAAMKEKELSKYEALYKAEYKRDAKS